MENLRSCLQSEQLQDITAESKLHGLASDAHAPLGMSLLVPVPISASSQGSAEQDSYGEVLLKSFHSL